MRSSRIALAGIGSMVALSAGLISRTTGTGTVTGRSRHRTIDYTGHEARRLWNDKVDSKKQERSDKRVDHLRKTWEPKKKRMLPAPSNRGATIIGDLIFNYQVHSNSLMSEFTNQRAQEYKRRVGGRTVDGVKAEAEHLHRARSKHQKKVSRMIGGRTLRVIQQLSTNQQQHFEEKRQHDWQLWEPVGDGIWQYQVHDEVFPYFMFNDEAGNLYEFDPAKLHFSSVEDCNQAMHLYVDFVNAKTDAEKADAEQAFTWFCEIHGHTLTAAGNYISADEAGDENYALEG